MSLEKSIREVVDKHTEAYRKEIEDLKTENRALREEIAELESELAVREDLETIRDGLFGCDCECEELPLEPIEVAQMLINSTFEYETSSVQRALFNADERAVTERYDLDALEQIAEHLMVYVVHNRDKESA